MKPLRVVTLAALAAVAVSFGCASGGGSDKAAAPLPPSGLTATPGDGAVTLAWSPVAASTSYRIYWATTPGVTTATGTQIATASTSHVHAALTNGTTYYYVVTAVSPAGESAASTQAGATPVGISSGAVSALAVGGNAFACGIMDGGAQCWGYGAWGQLGNDATTGTYLPGAVSGLTSSSGATAIAAGEYFACALVDGGVRCWGLGYRGQLGTDLAIATCDGSPCSPVPVQVSGLGSGSGVTAIAAGSDFACAVVDGGVRCWGNAGDGQLGTDAPLTTCGTVPCSLVPVQVSGLGGGSGVTAIAAGSNFACAVVGGGVRCWGNNEFYQLGSETTTTCPGTGRACSPVPRPVIGLPSGSGVAAISSGYAHTCVVVDGGVRCWGLGFHGEFGNGDRFNSPVPVQASGLESGSGVTAAAAGNNFSCAVVQGGVRCWGDNALGALGDGSATSCVIAGGVTQCGGNGVCGGDPCRLVPAQVSGLSSGSGVTAVAAGRGEACAVVNGEAWCWGSNGAGQLGAATTATCGGAPCSPVPVPVTGLTSGLR